MMFRWWYICFLWIGLSEAIWRNPEGEEGNSRNVRDVLTGSHSIEIRVFFDHWIFDTWKEIAAARTATDAEVQSMMKLHLRAIFRGVSEIFSGLKASGIDLDVRIASVHFEDTIVPEMDPPGSGLMDGRHVFHHMKNWMRHKWTERNTPGVADHTMLLTGLKFAPSANSDGTHQMGVALMGQMCTKNSLSVVQLRPPGSDSYVKALAHELTHSLNSDHDGSGNERDCYMQKHYLMYPVSVSNVSTSYMFSKCSVRAIRRYLNRRPRSDCLRQTSVRKDSYAPTMGSLVTLDQLCQMEHGPKAFFHRGRYVGDEMPFASCNQVPCNEGTNRKTLPFSMPADGSVCDKNKVCHLGKCVDSERPVDFPDYCPFGDAPAYARVFEGKTCEQLQISADSATLCYQSTVRLSCCSDCAAAYRQDRPGCAYGDHTEDCKRARPRDCYAGKNSKICCSSCAPYETGIPGCEYGDKAMGCKTMSLPGGCYAGDNGRTCCGSCAPYKTGIPGCEYGDKASWCGTSEYPYICTLNAQVCCQSCQKYYNASNIGCEYGDQMSACKTMPLPGGCHAGNNAKLCCGSCAPYLTGAQG